MTPAGDPPDGADGAGGFLSRWSRLKRQPAAPEAPATAMAEPPVDGAPAAPPTDEAAPASSSAPVAQAEAEERERQEIIARLPSIESITASTDITGFMHRLVPHAMRNAALRAAWSADPAIRDFLNDARDYALDYNTPGMAPGYGPLTESDDVQAMISQIFGRPVDKSLNFLTEDDAATPPPACGSESQSDVEEGDAALQHDARPAPDLVSVRLSDRSEPWNDSKEIPEFCPEPGDHPEDAAVQHQPVSSAPTVGQAVAMRRRGGRATPV